MTVNKTAIQNTAIAFWSGEDDCFIVLSPLMESVIGVGESIEEATREFVDILSDAYEAYLEGRMPTGAKAGRPARNRVALNTDVNPDTRVTIKELATKFGCSQGEIIDYLLAFHKQKGAQRAFDAFAGNKRSLSQVSESPRHYRTKQEPGRIVSPKRLADSDNAQTIIADLQRRISAVESMLFKKAKQTNTSKRRRTSSSYL
jgi:predicted RNase H-like HicB family nuclease